MDSQHFQPTKPEYIVGTFCGIEPPMGSIVSQSSVGPILITTRMFDLISYRTCLIASQSYHVVGEPLVAALRLPTKDREFGYALLQTTPSQTLDSQSFLFLGAINIGLIAPNLMVDHHLSHCLMAVCPLKN